MRHAPGTALCFATGILALFFCLVPPLSLSLGAFSLITGWFAAWRARRRPELYHPSAVPLASRVLVIMAWIVTAFVMLLVAAVAAPQPEVAAPTWELF
jgi:hypothetical protein